MTHKGFLKRMNARIKQHGSMRKYADHLGVAESYLSRVAGSKQMPGKKLLNDLGLKMLKTVTYRFRECRQ